MKHNQYELSQCFEMLRKELTDKNAKEESDLRKEVERNGSAAAKERLAENQSLSRLMLMGLYLAEGFFTDLKRIADAQEVIADSTRQTGEEYEGK